MPHNSQAILHFWFDEIESKAWWTKDQAFDERILREFGETHLAATRCELASWRTSAAGRLAEIIVLDQFSRNMFRGQPDAFAHDTLALALSQEAVNAGALQELADKHRPFLLMPFMHSESKIIHREAVDLFAKWAPGNLEYENKHKAIIDRFERYPHRNKVLGRVSSPEELEFLKQPGSSF